MKFCSRCDLEKEDICFGKNQVWCKICHLNYKKQYNIDNKERNKVRKHQYDIDNRDRQKDYVRSYRLCNKEKVAVNRRKYVKDRRTNDPIFRLNQIISSSINKALKKKNTSKNGKSSSKYLPYSFQELKQHLEKLFEHWMTWNNQGAYNQSAWDDSDPSTWTWNIDHIIPRSDLPYFSMEDDNFKKCWSLDNLRPLSSKQNIIDGANMTRHRKK